MTTATAPVNGLEIYYEIHGEGEPLVVLHGGVAPSYVPDIAALAQNRQVIVPHMQAHGHTPDIDRPLSAEAMADDVAALLRHLGIERADFLGYSMGGGVTLQTAIRHPELVSRMVLVSTTMRQGASFPEVLAVFPAMIEDAPQIAAGVAQSPLAEQFPDADWEVLFRKVGQMSAADYDWSTEVADVAAPTLLVFADADSITPEHMVEFWKAMGGGQRDAGQDGSLRPANRLAIIPGTTHYNIITNEALVPLAQQFFAEVQPEG